MKHFSCDVCGKTLHPNGEARFVWTVHGTPALDDLDDENTTLDEADLEEDSIDSMDELLAEREEQHTTDGDTVEMLPVCLQRAYDLCSGCYARMVNDPLGQETRKAQPFSRN
jgi:hypothetical protein